MVNKVTISKIRGSEYGMNGYYQVKIGGKLAFYMTGYGRTPAVFRYKKKAEAFADFLRKRVKGG